MQLLPIIYDVIIVGAGPAGCACALSLRNAGLKVALFDKKSFPRDKICGDAIPGRAIKTLQNISPEFAEEFRKFHNKYKTIKTRVSYKQQFLEFNWVGEAYTCARIEFDNFLFSLVKYKTSTDIFVNKSIESVLVKGNKVVITDKEKKTFESKIIIGADGAQSIIAKQLANRTIDRNHHVGSVRAYYKNVSNTISNTTEIYFNKKFLPSYLWVFPLPDNKANVGFGMLSSTISKKKVNIKNTFYEFIKQDAELTERFKNAEQTSDLEGFGLPLGSRRVKISGDNFLICGDAASLIDPASGDGIGNAMLSGKLAAEQIIKSFGKDDFSEKHHKNYDKYLFKVIGKELKQHYKAQRFGSKMPFLLDVLFGVAKNKLIQKWIQKKL